MYEHNEVYSGPTVADLYGPSTAVFQPGTLNGVAEPADLSAPEAVQGGLSSTPRRTSAWRGTPTSRTAFLGRLLGKSVYRGNFGINYYDEGLIPF